MPAEIRSTSGTEAAELAASAGLHLDDWQRFALDVALSERRDGRWSAFEVGLIVPRQNGKGSVLEARELAGLFLFGEKLILHSAHEFKTAAEAFLRIKALVDNTDDLRKKVARIRTSHGDEGIELTPQAGGGRLRFVARSNGSGRGFSGDTVILDEAYNLGPAQMAALLPTLSARDNPQVWYTSSAPLATSQQLHAVRRRALDGGSERLAFLEWSVDAERDDRADPQAWAKANPALGIRIPAEFVSAELEAMPEAEFDRERLGVPDAPLGERVPVIDEATWAACRDRGSVTVGPVVLAVDMPPGRGAATVAVAGRRGDGLTHVEVVEQRGGTAWVAAELRRLASAHDVRAVLLHPQGPAGGLVVDVEAVCVAAGVEFRPLSTSEYVQSCGQFYDQVTADVPAVRHLGQDELDVAVAAAERKASGDAWKWARQSTNADISPLVAVTLAAWGVSAIPEQTAPPAPVVVWG